MKKPILVTLLFLTAIYRGAFAQSATTTVNTVQPVIMVIPYAKEGEDMRTLLEADFNKRMAIAKVKNLFDNRGFTTRDFVATVKQAVDNKLFNSNIQSDVKSTIVELSGADIYVEVDINAITNGNAKQVRVLLSAYDAATASAYASITCDSRERYDSDDGTLVNRAISIPAPNNGTSQVPCGEDFLNILQAKFNDIVKNGRPIKVDLSLAPEAAHNFDSAIKTAGGGQLSDVIDDWMASNAFHNDYHSQGTTSSRLFYDVVKIPVRDDNNRNYKMNTFARKLTDFLQTKGITAKRAIKNGGIFITVVN